MLQLFDRGRKIHPAKLIEQFDPHKYAVIIKQHRLDKTKLKPSNNIVQIKDEFDSLELLPIADYVITDYSALTFEAALLHKPLYFWAYDYDTYNQECGLYHKLQKGNARTSVQKYRYYRQRH